jgi:SAM-dependent methyltransferase
MVQDPQRSIWDSFWAENASSENMFHWMIWRIRFLFSRAYASYIFKYMGKKTNPRLLEVGCGSARTLHYLDVFQGGGRCLGVDLSTIALKLLLRINPTYTTGVGSAFDLPLAANEYDASFSIGLIEHFTREEAARMVNEKIRVTKPSGVVAIMVPWQSSVYNLIVRKSFGRHWPFGHENPFRRVELVTFMETLGLQDVRVHVIYGTTLLGVGRKKP